MQSQTMTQSASLAGSQLAPARFTARRQARMAIVSMATRKVQTVDDDWKSGFFTSGYLLEDKERRSVNTLKVVEKNKLLSLTESLGLLSAADKAGFNLAKVEELKLLSTAEKLGLLTLAEKALSADPGAITSASLLPFIAAFGALVFIPTDNAVESVLRIVTAGTFFTAFLVLFVGGQVISGLQED